VWWKTSSFERAARFEAISNGWPGRRKGVGVGVEEGVAGGVGVNTDGGGRGGMKTIASVWKHSSSRGTVIGSVSLTESVRSIFKKNKRRMSRK